MRILVEGLSIRRDTRVQNGIELISISASKIIPHVRTRVRPRTAQRYAELLTQYVIPRIGHVQLAKLRPVHIQDVLDALLKSGLSARTVLHTYRITSSALRQAVRWQILPANPAQAVSPPRPERTNLTVPTPEQVGAIVRAAEGTDLHVAIVLGATTGMRRGEVLGLKWSEVDLEAGRLRVVASLQDVDGAFTFVDPKTDRARRTIALPPMTVDVFRRHKREQAERRLLLGPEWVDAGVVVDAGNGAPMSPGKLSHGFAAIVRGLGFGQVRLHDLRHAFATTLLASGIHPAVASEVLGHSSPAFTMSVYQHVLPSMSEQAAQAIQASLSPTH